MATLNATSDLAHTPPSTATLLVSLGSMPQDAHEQMLANLELAFPHTNVTVASPDLPSGSNYPAGSSAGATSSEGSLRVVGYTPTVQASDDLTLTAPDFVNAHELTREHQARSILVLGPEAHTLSPASLLALAAPILGERADLCLAQYVLPPRTGLVNSAMLYPLSRALFNSQVRFPLAIDLCLSSRMLERLAAAGQRFTSANQNDALIWPVIEACVAGVSIAEAEQVTRVLPQPIAPDLNTLLAHIVGSLFTEIDQKATYWQRARPAQTLRTLPLEKQKDCGSLAEMQPMLDAFRLAYGNLHELWSLVLPPQTLLGLKRLAAMPAESFAIPDALWARIVYDFLLAHRLRTINRGHLLGALTPLYLAWVASHIRSTIDGCDPERHIEAVAAAFVADKPYLVSRWRWPDRFNP